MSSCLPYHIDRTYTVVYGNNSYYGQGPQLTFFKGKLEVSLVLSRSVLPSAQDNSHVKVARVWETSSGTLHYKSLNVAIMSSFFTYSMMYICHLFTIAITCQIYSTFYSCMKKTLNSNNRYLVKFISELTIS